MSFAVEPVFVPYPVTIVAETEGAAHHRGTHDEPNRRQPHPHAETPSPADSPAASVEVESSPLVGRLIDVRA